MFIWDVWLDGVVARKQPLVRLGANRRSSSARIPAFQSTSVA